MPSSANAQAAVRATMRARRRSLSAHEVAEASTKVVDVVRVLPLVESATWIATYRAVAGEICLDVLIDGPVGARCTVPRVQGHDLEFVTHRSVVSWREGAFGIAEPEGGEVIEMQHHDVVLVPVVAFDVEGSRIGQGGGFYDRALAGVRGTEPAPTLIGVAHDFQRVEAIPRQPWDVSLDAVVTETTVYETITGGLR